MVTVDTIEGFVEGIWWFHYDVGNDVLYLRLASKRHAPALGEETDQGFTLFRDAETDDPIGLMVLSWWARYGGGDLPDSVSSLTRSIEPWTQKIAA